MNKKYVVYVLFVLIGVLYLNTFKVEKSYSNNLNDSNQDESHFVKTIKFDNHLYKFYISEINNKSKIKFMVYDDKQKRFKYINDTCLNQDTNQNITQVNPIVHQNELYLFFTKKTNNDENIITAKKFKNNTWMDVNCKDEHGLFYAADLNVCTHQNELYLFFIKNIKNGENLINAKKFKNNTWTNINCKDEHGIFYGLKPKSIIYKDELYLVFNTINDNNFIISSKKLEENRWANISIDSTNNTSVDEMCIFNNQLFLISSQLKNKKVFIHKLEDSNIQFCDYQVINNAENPKSIIYKNELYLFWIEYSQNNRAQLKCTKLNSKNQWVHINNNDFNKNLQKSNAKDIILRDVIVYEDKIFLSYVVENSDYKFNVKTQMLNL